MKKFTLLLFSLFLTLGTAVAQDDAFQLTYSNPSNDVPSSRVDVIQLMFNKEVTVILPAEPIVIKEKETNAEYLVVKGEAYGPNAILRLQKADNAEVMAISEPGTYTYTIPAGVIKSVDGDVFDEYSATFTVIQPLEVVNVTPTRTTKLETIQFTFNTPIASVNSAALAVVDKYWTPVSNIKNNAVISEDGLTVTLELETPITAIGNYNLDVYPGIFTSANGLKNEYASYAFEVYDPTPSFAFNYENETQVKEITDLEITFKNVNEVKLVEGASPVVVYIPGGTYVEGVASVVDNKITVKFNQEFTEKGDYTFVIPANFFTMDGTPNEICEINVTLVADNITPLEVVNVSPELGKVEKLERIVITFNQNVRLSYDDNWQMVSGKIKMTSGDKEFELTYNSNSNVGSSVEYIVNAEYVNNEYVTKAPITEPGAYTLNLADIIVDHAAEQGVDEYGYPATIWNSLNKSCEGTISWTIEEDTAIDEVKGENGEVKTIYDITGRRIENITAPGIYIVGGKKQFVK